MPRRVCGCLRPSLASALLLLVLTALGGCGGPQAAPSPARPTTSVTMPETVEAQHEAIDALGRALFAAMREGDPVRLLLDDVDLRTLLEAPAATRIAVRRAGLAERVGSTRDFPSLMASAEYAGICLQGARDEPAGGVLGLRSPGWVVDRVLIIGRRPSGRRIAAWVEGLWLYSDRGFGAAELERVEEPRWEHSDLEIAPCDLSIRNDLPEIAR